MKRVGGGHAMPLSLLSAPQHKASEEVIEASQLKRIWFAAIYIDRGRSDESEIEIEEPKVYVKEEGFAGVKVDAEHTQMSGP